MEQKKSSTDEGQLQGGLLLDTGENKRGDGAEGEGGGGGEQTSNQSPAADGAEIVPQTVAPKKKKKAPAAKDPEGCYFFPGCTEKTYQNVPRFKYPKQPEFTQPSQLCLYHLDWQPTQFYYICAYCAIFHREDEVKFAKMPVDGKELKKLKDRKNKKKGAGGKKGKKSAKSAAPKKGKGKKGGGKGEDGEEVEKPKEDPIKNEIQVAICRNCLPKGCETVYPALDQPKADEQGG